MRKKNQAPVLKTKFDRVPEIVVDGFTIVKGDLMKIRGEYGVRFKFDSLTTNTETNVQWVDCFEVTRGQVGAFRSFRIDRIKRIPKRRIKKVVKNVN